MFLTQWSKTQSAEWGGMSLSGSSGCSDSVDFDSMRIQLNLGGPLWRNNNNDKCTSVAGLKEAGRNVLLCWPVLTQLIPGSCRIGRFLNKISPCEWLCFLDPVWSFKYSDDLALCNTQTSPPACALNWYGEAVIPYARSTMCLWPCVARTVRADMCANVIGTEFMCLSNCVTVYQWIYS